MKQFALALIVGLSTLTAAFAQCGDSVSCGSLFEGCNSCEPSPWTFRLTQTVDYGTNLTLPIGLTPANTLLTPAGAGGGFIINDNLLGGLGLLDNLVGGAPVADVPTSGGFEDDWMFRTFADVGYQRQAGDNGLFTVGYGYYQNLHAQIEQLDLSSHTVSTQYAHQLNDEWTGAINYSFAFYELDFDSLVSQNNVGTGLAWRPAGLWSYELNLNFSDSNFRSINSLDAQFWSGRLSTTRYLDECRTDWITFGQQYGYWDARQSTFSYDLYSSFVSLRWALDRDASTNLDVGGSYGNYDFRGVDFVQQDRRREDNIYGINSTLSHQLNDRWLIFASYIYTNSDSNVLRQDYAGNFVSTGVTVTF